MIKPKHDTHKSEITLRLKHAKLCILVAALRNGEVELPQLGREKRSPCSGASGNSVAHLVVIGVALLNHVHEALAARNVEPFEFGVVEKVVGVAGNGKVGHGIASDG